MIILSLNKINLHSVVLLTMIKVSGLKPAASSIKIPLQKSFQGGTSVEILQDHNPWKVSNWVDAVMQIPYFSMPADLIKSQGQIQYALFILLWDNRSKLKKLAVIIKYCFKYYFVSFTVTWTFVKTVNWHILLNDVYR